MSVVADRARYAFGVRWALSQMKEKTRHEKCRRLGVTPTTLDKWRDGVSVPSDDNLARLARAANTGQETIRSGGADD